jgi:glycosyltransferase involved in cell wall biosynthesis
LHAPRDAAALAQALAELAGDPQLRARLGARGRARFTEQFRHQVMTARIRALYEHLLAKTSEKPSAPNASRQSRQPVK